MTADELVREQEAHAFVVKFFGGDYRRAREWFEEIEYMRWREGMIEESKKRGVESNDVLTPEIADASRAHFPHIIDVVERVRVYKEFLAAQDENPEPIPTVDR